MKIFGILRNGFRNSWIVRQARYQKDSSISNPNHKDFYKILYSIYKAETRLESREGEKHQIDNAAENSRQYRKSEEKRGNERNLTDK